MLPTLRPAATFGGITGVTSGEGAGDGLSPEERREAEGLVDLAEFLSLPRLRSVAAGAGA
jgi:hypothetical protein